MKAIRIQSGTAGVRCPNWYLYLHKWQSLGELYMVQSQRGTMDDYGWGIQIEMSLIVFSLQRTLVFRQR